MNKIFLIISREYLTRIRKKSFIVMSILGPLLFAAMFVIPIWMSTRESDEVKTIAVIDSTMEFINQLESEHQKNIIFIYQPKFSLEQYKKDMKNSKEYDAVLYIPRILPYSPNSAQLVSHGQINYSITSYITSKIETLLTEKKMRAFGIDNFEKIMQSAKTKINLQTITVSARGDKKSDVWISWGLGYFFGFMTYIFIFMFGAQVMRGVIEEKTNRIVEVIISSVKPFQLMMGKVIGIALVVLTQITFWIVMTTTIVLIVKAVFLPDVDINQLQGSNPQSIMSPSSSMAAIQTPSPSEDASGTQLAFDKLGSINWVKIVGWFIFFFIGGYLLYGAFFAAIGSVVDNETDTQQFMLPITIPLVFALFVMFYALKNHDSNIAYWFSLFPLTSPIVMMARIPFDPPTSEILISAGLLVLSFVGAIWMAGKIYRTGILIYGKKIGYKEIFKWLKYKH